MKRIDLRTITDTLEIILPGGARLTYTPATSDTTTLTLDALSALFDDFHTEQSTYTTKRAGTLKNYRQTFAQFAHWLRDSGASNITAEHWRRYYATERTRGLSVHTIRNRYRDLTVFIHWLIEHGHIPDNPLENITPPAPPKNTPPKAIAETDILRMLRAADTLRDKTLLLFFLDTGCRAGEAAALTWSNIDLDAGTAAVVDGKAHKARYLFLSDGLIDLLRRYRDTIPHAPDDPLWTGKKGRLTAWGIRQVFRRIAERANVTENWNPHAWRHAFGRHATIDGMPTGTLQQILGHSSIETTQIYLNLDTDALKTAHDQHTPARLIDQTAENG